MLLLLTSRRGDVKIVLDEDRVSSKPLWQIEEDLWGFSHAELGSQLLKSWNLPEPIYKPIRNFQVIDEGCKYKEVSHILKTADLISSVYHGNDAGNSLRQVYQQFAHIGGISEQEIDALVDEVGTKSREIMEIFSVDPGDIQPISSIMQQSNNELKKLNLSYEQIVFELQQAKQNAEKLALELKTANEKLNNLAFHDELTGIYNHRYFQNALDDEMYRTVRYNGRLSILLLDIDYFKKVNDTYGHLVGDLVLQQVAKGMLNLGRQSDIIARYGGEEFAIILPETGLSGAKVIGQRIRRGIEQLNIIHEDSRIPITVSIGASSVEMLPQGSNKKDLISLSDDALYQAKRNGQNQLAVVDI